MDDFIKDIMRIVIRKSIKRTLDDLENAMSQTLEDMHDDADAHTINAMFKEELVTQVSERFGSLSVIEDVKGGDNK